MNPLQDKECHETRRTFLGKTAGGIGQIALGSLLSASMPHAVHAAADNLGSGKLPHFAPKAKRIVCLFQAGGMSHVDLFDNKPSLAKFNGHEIPPSVKGDQRLTGMTSGQSAYPVVAPLWQGRLCGQQGTWISDQLPSHAGQSRTKFAS